MPVVILRVHLTGAVERVLGGQLGGKVGTGEVQGQGAGATVRYRRNQAKKSNPDV